MTKQNIVEICSVEERLKNVLAFLTILFGESTIWHEQIMDFSPAYLIEKFERYVLSRRDESSWGLHPSLRRGAFKQYCDKYKISLEDE